MVVGRALTQTGVSRGREGRDPPPGKDRMEEDVTEGCKTPSETGKPNKEHPCIPSARMWLKGHQMNHEVADWNRTKRPSPCDVRQAVLPWDKGVSMLSFYVAQKAPG